MKKKHSRIFRSFEWTEFKPQLRFGLGFGFGFSFVSVSVSVSVSASVRVFRQMRRIMKTKRSQKWVVSRRQMGSRGPALAAGQPVAVSEVAGRVTQFIRHPVLEDRRQTKQAMAFGH